MQKMMELVMLLCLVAVGLGNPVEQLQAAAAARESAEVQRAKRCANVWDDSCVNAGVNGASDDGLYFESGSSPGKRWAPDQVHRLLVQMGRQAAAKRCANVWDDSCVNAGVNGASDDGLYFESGSSPGKRWAPDQVHRLLVQMGRQAAAKRCANVWDDSCVNAGVNGASDDGLYFESGSSPGKRWAPDQVHRLLVQMGRQAAAKRCANVWDDSCVNAGVNGASDDGLYFESGSSPGKRWAPDQVHRLLVQMGRQATAKRCANVWDDSCVNAGVNGASDDGLYFESGSSPGKRWAPDQVHRLLVQMGRQAAAKRCANVWDDSCVNAGVNGASDDGLYFESGSSPGKRWAPDQVHRLLVQMGRQAAAKRCANVWDDSCVNAGVNGASDDGLYFESGSSPGKRWAPDQVHRLLVQMGRQAAAKRCANVWDDSCVNAGVNGASDDGLYFESGSSPGKRWAPDQVHRLLVQMGRQAAAKRCANVWDDSCVNAGVNGASDDGLYFESGSSPGKRSLADQLRRLQMLRTRAGAKRCANVWDDSCVNAGVSGASDDGLYFESGNSPGK